MSTMIHTYGDETRLREQIVEFGRFIFEDVDPNAKFPPPLPLATMTMFALAQILPIF